MQVIRVLDASGERPIRVSADGGEAAARLRLTRRCEIGIAGFEPATSRPQNIISAPPTSSLHFYLSAENGRPDKLFDELTRFCALSKYLKSTIRRHCSQQNQGNNHYVGKTHKSGKSNKYGVFRRHRRPRPIILPASFPPDPIDHQIHE